MLEYQSEFRTQQLRTLRQRLLIAAILVGLLAAFGLVGSWDQDALRDMKDAALRAAVERTNVRPYFLSPVHCPIPREGEVLHMRHAPPDAPGNGFECAYYTNVGYGRAPRLSGLKYSRGWKLAARGEL